MGYTFYATSVFVPASNPLSFEQLVEAVKRRFEGWQYSPEIAVDSKTIVLKHDDWALRIWWQDEPYVLGDAQEMAERLDMNPIKRDRLKTSTIRITTAGDPDPDMNYFNDYVFVLETLNTLENVIRFDPHMGIVDEFGDV